LPLTAALIDTAAPADLLDGLMHEYDRRPETEAGSSCSHPRANRQSHNTTRAANVVCEASRPAPKMRTVLYRNRKLPLLRPGSTPKEVRVATGGEKTDAPGSITAPNPGRR
jgi:hypothetical protein